MLITAERSIAFAAVLPPPLSSGVWMRWLEIRICEECDHACGEDSLQGILQANR